MKNPWDFNQHIFEKEIQGSNLFFADDFLIQSKLRILPFFKLL